MPIRLVIDTNVWISYLLTSNFDFLDRYFQNDSITFLYNEQLLSEITQVALRPKFEKYISPADIQKLRETLEGLGEYTDSKTDIDLSRDVKDNYLLSLALDGKAEYLVSGDKDLLILKSMNQVKIVTPKELEKLLATK